MAMNMSFIKFCAVIIILFYSAVSNAYAAPLKNDVPTSSYIRFTKNIMEGRYVVNDIEETFRGDFVSPWAIPIGIIIVHVGLHIILFPETLGSDDTLDPQVVFVFKSLKVDGQEALDKLASEALLSKYVASQKYIPDLFGGTVVTGTKAFDGDVLDSDGNSIQGINVGFVVFQPNQGSPYLGMVVFMSTGTDADRIASISMNFGKAIPVTGSFEAITTSVLSVSEEYVVTPIVSSVVDPEQGLVYPVTCPDVISNSKVVVERFTNTSSSVSHVGLAVRVKKIATSGQALVFGTDEALGGVSTRVTVPRKGDYSDGILAPGESVDVPFFVCSNNSVSTVSIDGIMRGTSF